MIGLFETLGAFDGRLLLWQRHLERLRGGADRLGLEVPQVEGLRGEYEALLAGRGDDVLRLELTAGRGFEVRTRRRVRAARPLLLRVGSERRERGDPHAALKCTERALLDRAWQEARAGGAADAVLLDDTGHVLETAVGNLFFCLGGCWCTPRASGALLPGIARALLLEQLEIKTGDYLLDDLQRSDAICVTNAVYGPRLAALRTEPEPGSAKCLEDAWRRGLRGLR